MGLLPREKKGEKGKGGKRKREEERGPRALPLHTSHYILDKGMNNDISSMEQDRNTVSTDHRRMPLLMPTTLSDLCESRQLYLDTLFTQELRYCYMATLSIFFCCRVGVPVCNAYF